MADAIKLFQAAIQALDAGAEDLAIDFAQRAIQELRGDSGSGSALPWSTDPRDERFMEFAKRGVGFLKGFAAEGTKGMSEVEAKKLAREFFPEQPRVVGPSFYRVGALETDASGGMPVVRITKSGQGFLKQLEKQLAILERRTPVY